MKRLFLSLIIAAIFVPAGTVGAYDTQGADFAASAEGPTDCMEQPVAQLAQESITGNASVCADQQGVQADMRVEHLTPGNVYTVWFAYLDRRANCAATPCTGADFRGEDPVGVFGRMDGGIADQTGIAWFKGDMRGLRLSDGSEVWLLIFGHGPANTDDHRALARQILTPQDPALGAPAAGLTLDGAKGSGVARAVFDIG